MRLSEWRLELALAALVLALNLTGAGRFGLFDVDEAIFAEATRELVETGDWVTPHYNGGVRYDKPPLIYWVMALPLKLCGPTPAAARATSAVASALLVLVLAAAGRLLFGGLAGLYAGLAMGTCLQGFVLARWSATDMVLTLLMACAWLSLLAMTETKRTGWSVAAAAFLALATLTKGPVAVVLPVGSWLVWALLTGELGGVARCWRLYWGKLVFWAVLLPWCYLIYRAHHWDFFREFLLYHNKDRFTNKQSGHGGPLYTFFVVAFVGLAPWTGWVLAGLGRALRWPVEEREPRARLYVALWLLAVLALFTASKTKLPSYIAPLYPAAALLAGWALDRAVARAKVLVVCGALPGLVLGTAFCASPLWLPRLGVWQRELGLARPAPAPALVVGGVLLVVCATVALVSDWRRDERAAPVLALCGAGSWLALWLTVGPFVWQYQQSSVALMGAAATRQMAPGDVLATLNVHIPSLAFTTRQTFRRLTVQPDRQSPELCARARAELRALFEARQRVFLITQRARTQDALVGIGYHVWAERLGWQLLSNQSAPPHYELTRTGQP